LSVLGHLIPIITAANSDRANLLPVLENETYFYISSIEGQTVGKHFIKMAMS
jgi:hypothetical protein